MTVLLVVGPLAAGCTVPQSRASWAQAVQAGGGDAGVHTAPTMSAPPSTTTLDEIVLERDCFGCPAGQRVLLKRDGSLLLQRVGKARHGSTDAEVAGRVSGQAFDMLARQLLQQGLLEWQEQYDDAELADGAWAVLRASGAGVAKQIWWREGQGPAALTEAAAAIDVLVQDADLRLPAR